MGNSIERANYMKQNPFNCNECNFTFVVNTHMMRQLYLALGRPRITVKREPTTREKKKQFNCNECNFRFVKSNTFKTHMKRQCYLAPD